MFCISRDVINVILQQLLKKLFNMFNLFKHLFFLTVEYLNKNISGVQIIIKLSKKKQLSSR